MLLLLMAVFLAPLIIVIVSKLLQWSADTYWAMRQRLIRSRQLTFDSNYLDVKEFFVRLYKQVPCIWFVNSIDGSKVFEYIRDGHAGKVIAIYQKTYYNWSRKRQEFSQSVFRLANKVMIEV